MVRKISTTFLLLLFLASAQARSAEGPGWDPLFTSDEVLEATLTAPLTTITKNRSVEEELPGTLRIGNRDYEVAVRARGRFRRDKDICDFPPLRLNFKKSETKDTLLHGSDKVKLVTHCEDGSTRYDQYVIREYLAYRILNILTDDSFGARLLRITYVDSEGKRKDREHFGVLIEHRDRLAKRRSREYLEIPKTTVASLDPAHTNIVSLYQYLIGNTDFSPVQGSPGEPCCHNHVLFGNEGEPFVSIPYDFDQSGIVDAEHAGPNPRFNLRDVTQRLYRGRCVNNHLLPQTIDLFKAKRPEIEALITNLDGMAKNSRRKVLSYLDRFYKVIETPKSAERPLVKACLK
jgi:hypothetical protein